MMVIALAALALIAPQQNAKWVLDERGEAWRECVRVGYEGIAELASRMNRDAPINAEQRLDLVSEACKAPEQAMRRAGVAVHANPMQIDMLVRTILEAAEDRFEQKRAH